jgi:hypothetical protein
MNNIKDTVERFIPNLRVLGNGTIYEATSEIDTYRQVIKVTLFYTEPGRPKTRVTFEYPNIALENVRPKHVRIKTWGVA